MSDETINVNGDPLRLDPLIRMEMEAVVDALEPGLLDDLGIPRCVLPEAEETI